MIASSSSSSILSLSLGLLALLSLTLMLMPTSVEAVRSLRIVSPLQALTIWDPPPPATDDETSTAAAAVGAKTVHADSKKTAAEQQQQPVFVPKTFRQRFLPKFKTGLKAEVEVRKDFAAKRKQSLQASAVSDSSSSSGSSSPEWAQKAAATERRWQRAEERRAAQAFEQAVQQYQEEDDEAPTKSAAAKKKIKNPNQYQFVGVINNNSKKASASSSTSPITWYARKKPATGADWSVRLVHVNRQAIWKDLFQRGKVDVFAKYQNTGKTEESTSTTVGGEVGGGAKKSHVPVITSQYTVRPRSWKNLWNFSPKHLFTDSSGMYWRERRLRPGLYTDGKTVYKASYRYRDGRNGMHPLSTYEQYLASPAVSSKQKEQIQKRLQKDAPTIVLEE